MKREQIRLFRPMDAVLIALLLGGAAVLFAVLATRPAGTVAEIMQENRVLYTVALDTPGETRYTVGGKIPVEIAAGDGAVWFAAADCPDKICVRSGKLRKAGDTAACLPAGVVIRVRGGAADATTG